MAASLVPPSTQPVVDPRDPGPGTAIVPSEKTTFGATGLNVDGPVSRLPVELDVAVPIRDFRVRNLLALESGIVVASQWAQSEDLPVMSGNQTLAWSEFEVVDLHLAVRLTRLS